MYMYIYTKNEKSKINPTQIQHKFQKSKIQENSKKKCQK